MPLTPSRTRVLVVTLVGVSILIALVASVLILRGWQDREFQQEMREVRRERGLRY